MAEKGSSRKLLKAKGYGEKALILGSSLRIE